MINIMISINYKSGSVHISTIPIPHMIVVGYQLKAYGTGYYHMWDRHSRDSRYRYASDNNKEYHICISHI